MPLKHCKVGRSSGFKFGKTGKCYISKKKAIKQGVAIILSKQKKKRRR